MGCTFKHPAFQDAGDDETGVAVYKFKNGAMGMVHVGRTSPYGYHICDGRYLCHTGGLRHHGGVENREDRQNLILLWSRNSNCKQVSNEKNRRTGCPTRLFFFWESVHCSR